MSESDSTKLTALWCILCIFFCVSSATEEPHGEASALLKWKASLKLDSQTILSSWKNGTSPCRNWTGISCDESSFSVSMINLTSLGLQGRLQNLSFSSLPNLVHFDISYNNFSGNIPPQVSNLSSILRMIMSHNFLEGPIPKEIGSLSTLNLLDISVCNLTDSIPPEIGNLSSLTDLILGLNRLSGSIPQEIGRLSNLTQLDLSENPFQSGEIPSAIGNLRKLKQLYLYDCSLTGRIPNELGKLHSLVHIQLLDNNLYGPIPSFIGNLTNLQSLYLYTNNLSGSIPASIGNLVNLEILDLGENNLSGPIPSTIGNLTALTQLVLFHNNLSGHIPPEVDNLTSLVDLQLGWNNFIGHLPQHICLGGMLERFGAPGNSFTGLIPTSLKNCSKLERLTLNDNQLVQDISNSFGTYPNLEFIDLSGNKLYGHLSSTWGKCPSLSQFKISSNNISGRIPSGIGGATNLFELDLSSNHLVGEIPTNLLKLTSLSKLSLSHNQLLGKIPPEIGSLNHLEILELEGNKFSGPITEKVWGMKMLRELNMSKNKFEGPISLQFGQLQDLEKLDLSENFLSGKIPKTIGALPKLQILNLSHNSFSGEISSAFNGRSALTSVDISYNQLEGPIPNNHAFQTFAALKNNKGLCGNVTGLHLCSDSSQNNVHGNKKSEKVKLLIIFLPLGVVVLLVGTGVFSFFCHGARKARNKDEEVQEDLFLVWSSERELLYQDIVEATKNFDDRYLVGKGGQGSIYRAELPTGLVVAVKKLHSMPSGEISNLTAFTSEIRALTEIKHRNIVKLYGFCSNSRSSFLVYEFLEGGSLNNILKNDEQAIKLDWNRRMNLVKSVANALFHMHHGCSIPIVHRDISSKNVVLDSEYQEARIIDFGTAKFLNPESENITSFVGTFGYAAPEITYIIKANEKCDVYSFGVLTLEIIMGMHPGELIASLTETPTTYDLPLKDVLDGRLPRPTGSVVEELMLIATLAFACLDKNPWSRPTMDQVAMKLMTPKTDLVDQFDTITIGQLIMRGSN
ncbi:MDIS1-interacting receptor like kinase 2-like [Prosopis cineraria]|uniref:MDIS1-interacting receptor like kinase 2-like n=1 Tax=Prosopis cineraria TaxID=364024 RepID=UPI00241033EA|nr:MDIS1-interacting receptor like kinase 2-like [Prosopis cineraria]